MKLLSLLTVVLPVLLLGCPSGDDGADSPNGGASSGQSTTSTTNPPVPPGQSEPVVPDDASDAGTREMGEITLKQLDWAGVMSLVEANHGKVVVVDLWSLSCEPCIIEFPNLVTLAHEHPEEVVCISVATDYQGLANRPLSHYEPRVLEFLQSQNADIENVLCTVPKPEFFAELEIGSEPAIYVFNQAGESELFTGLQDDDTEISYERHVIPHVEGLLAVE